MQYTPTSETMLRWGLQCTKLLIVLEDKKGSFDREFFIMISVDELLTKIMNV